MKEDVKVAILRIEGTNCEEESLLAFRRLGVQAEYVHLKEFLGIDFEKKDLFDYECVFIPGGFSSGDYVRAGAIFAARMKALMNDVKEYVKNGYVVIGICNGFQVLMEMGLLPAIHGISERPEACLAVNDSCRFECRPTLLRHENVCPLTSKIKKGEILLIPSAHMEGKVVFPKGKEEEFLEEMEKNGQIVFRYVDINGDIAEYPWNPNGSFSNIAGMCNPEGNVLGMMPHPERAFYPWQQIDWGKGDGKAIFESVVEYIRRV
ncbi:MAG: phosphoribosylformylglycinamidine synthase subunit PurQ [Thermoplasmata archaeon]|nr:MAG: phosphoribosylformylglycinamidine synthase subunit PurQ [Thermoplasmata archaeon]